MRVWMCLRQGALPCLRHIHTRILKTSKRLSPFKRLNAPFYNAKKKQFRKTPPSVLLKFWRSHAWTVSGPGPGRLPLSLSRRLPRPKIFQQVHLQTPSLKRQITSEAFGLSSYTPGRACAGASLCTGPRRRDAGSPMWLPLSVSPRASFVWVNLQGHSAESFVHILV